MNNTPSVHKEMIFKLYEQGMSYSEIQKELGCAKSTISYHIGKGQKEKSHNRKKQSRHRVAAYVRKAKQGQKCVVCREDYPYWKMEFDHLPQYKKLFTIGGKGARDKTIEDIQAEMDKCEIVCRNCHADRTYWRALKNGEYDDTISYYE